MLFCYFEAWLYFLFVFSCCWFFHLIISYIDCRDWDCLLLITVIVSARPHICGLLGQIVSTDWITED